MLSHVYIILSSLPTIYTRFLKTQRSSTGYFGYQGRYFGYQGIFSNYFGYQVIKWDIFQFQKKMPGSIDSVNPWLTFVRSQRWKWLWMPCSRWTGKVDFLGKKVLAKSMQKNGRFSVWLCFHVVCFPWSRAGAKRNFKSSLFQCHMSHDLWKPGNFSRCAESQLVAWCAERSLVTWSFWKTMDDGQKLQGEWQLFHFFLHEMATDLRT